jgi:hypothetical protein
MFLCNDGGRWVVRHEQARWASSSICGWREQTNGTGARNLQSPEAVRIGTRPKFERRCVHTRTTYRYSESTADFEPGVWRISVCMWCGRLSLSSALGCGIHLSLCTLSWSTSTCSVWDSGVGVGLRHARSLRPKWLPSATTDRLHRGRIAPLLFLTPAAARKFVSTS